MCQNWVNVLIFDIIILTRFHELTIKINHIGFNVGLQGIGGGIGNMCAPGACPIDPAAGPPGCRPRCASSNCP